MKSLVKLFFTGWGLFFGILSFIATMAFPGAIVLAGNEVVINWRFIAIGLVLGIFTSAMTNKVLVNNPRYLKKLEKTWKTFWFIFGWAIAGAFFISLGPLGNPSAMLASDRELTNAYHNAFLIASATFVLIAGYRAMVAWKHPEEIGKVYDIF